jgi:hypothetical protein
VGRYREALASITVPIWREGNESGYTLAYSGPGSRPHSQPTFS